MSERSVVRLLKRKYPSIYDELAQRPSFSNIDRIPHLLQQFCEFKGLEACDVIKNKDQSRMLFIAIAAKLYDPIFFVDHDKNLIRGLREKLAENLHCHETQISNTLTTVRTYLKAYQHFREEVQYFYGKIALSNAVIS